MPSTDKVDELVAYREILELRHAYCHHIDAHRYDQWADLFTEDGVFASDGDRFEGREEIRDLGTSVMDEKYDYSAHVVSNPVVDVDGDEATGQWYFFLRFALSDGSVGWKQGVYDETYRNVDGAWLFDVVDAETRATRTFEPQVTF